MAFETENLIETIVLHKGEKSMTIEVIEEPGKFDGRRAYVKGTSAYYSMEQLAQAMELADRFERIVRATTNTAKDGANRRDETMNEIYTSDEAVRDGFIVRFPERVTFLDMDGISYVQAEYGTESEEGEFEPIGFCYEA